MKKLLWTLIFVFTVSGVCSAQSVIYFPQIAEGLQSSTVVWASIIALTNTAAVGTATASGTITFRQDNGSLLNLVLYDENENRISTGSSVSFQIAGGQTKFFSTSTLVGAPTPTLVTGYAEVSSNSPLSGMVVFLEGSAQRVLGQATVFAATPLTRQTIFAVHDSEDDTGIAVANPSATTTANITFQLLDINGVVLATGTRTLAARNHTAFFIRELFPNVTQSVIGTMRITSDVGIVTLGLLFGDEGGFTTLPVFPLQ